MIKDKYNAREEFRKLKKKYNLPSLKELETNFEFRLSKDSEEIFSEIKNSIMDKISEVIKTVQSVVFVREGSSPCCFYESKFLGKKKQKFFKLYKKSLYIHWRGVYVGFEPSEKNLAEFIKESYNLWIKELKKEILRFSRIMISGWKKPKEKSKEEQSYFG